MKITGETDAWLPPWAMNIDLSDARTVVKTASFTNLDMSNVASGSYLKIGRATITIDLSIDNKGKDEAQVQILKAQLTEMAAKYEAGRTEILRRISELTALPFEQG